MYETRKIQPARRVILLAVALALAACGGSRAAEAVNENAPATTVSVPLTAAEVQHKTSGSVRSSDGRDPYLSARDQATGEFVRDIATGEPFFAAAAAVIRPAAPWWVQHLVLSSDGRDPYLSARDPATGEFILDIATGEPLR